MSRVRPGVLLTNANRFPASALMALDLPEFERPAKAISPTLAGTSSSEAALLKKETPRKSNMDGRINFARISAFWAKVHEEKGHETSLGAFEFRGLCRPDRRRGARRRSRCRQGAKHRQQGLRGLPRCRWQQPDVRQSKAREPDSRAPAEAARQFQACSRKKGRARKPDHGRHGCRSFRGGYARRGGVLRYAASQTWRVKKPGCVPTRPENLARRRPDQRPSCVCCMPRRERSGSACAIPAPGGAVRRIHRSAAEGVPLGRAPERCEQGDANGRRKDERSRNSRGGGLHRRCTLKFAGRTRFEGWQRPPFFSGLPQAQPSERCRPGIARGQVVFTPPAPSKNSTDRRNLRNKCAKPRVCIAGSLLVEGE